MDVFPKSLLLKLEQRKQNNALRKLPITSCLVDFSSNDYLGFSKSETIFCKTHQFLCDRNIKINGATGSRLLSGNHHLYQETEDFIAGFHQSEKALIFNSGYDANIGFFSAVPQRNDIVLYDELCHASIRDGIIMSHAKAFKFNHNDYEDLESKIIELKFKYKTSEFYIATESVFSMDGDCPNLQELIIISENYNVHLVIDEAHALGVIGAKGQGLVQELQLQNKVFARIITFGKGLGCHGAAVLGSQNLKEYLVNFARSFIYTTGLSPHSVATILVAYHQLENDTIQIGKLRENIIHFNQEKQMLGLRQMFVRSKSAIQSAIIPGNQNVKNIAKQIQEKGFDAKAILSPTVPEGQERLRICLHSYNSKDEISEMLRLLSNCLFLA
ncbi:pyridoxal phosphate-dependent aminotransferase family protein [Flavobacterium psychrophilum]|uniref:aminotransferase class I/II-fold pyridoxal phosphate-dependent enzyme n=1 Tax=Flavobacterium psychrophilum TaxID=96345 RepID=UPI000B7C1D76|nr:pyridoxal phosphate-dependent aminotransferase family protein [Flavobacterium psychrophilum]ELY1991601.1 pyridoxal phosphate-dependent aminotransferase family protein [Flavobacterium psychrophilum]GEJ37246.1 8-amino-7-oxononanoate synthase [Flavobacterium psychrophilum]GEJ49899.1 8-amino-7-oxononanoate synthase [Flavobacterium psychrophilum]SNA75563.1 8-amino-7-oxononanoate synthase [Flavobacterium psychrophilum]